MIIIAAIKMPRNPVENIHGAWSASAKSASVAGISLQTHPPWCAMAQKKPAAVLFHGTLLPVQNFGHEYANSDVKNAPDSCALRLCFGGETLLPG